MCKQGTGERLKVAYVVLKIYIPIPAAKIMDRFFVLFFLLSFDYIPVQDKLSFDPSGLLPDVYSVCFRIMFPGNLTHF